MSTTNDQAENDARDLTDEETEAAAGGATLPYDNIDWDAFKKPSDGKGQHGMGGQS